MKKTNLKKWDFAIYLFFYVAIHVLFSKIISKNESISTNFAIWVQLSSYVILGMAGIWLFKEEWKKGFQKWKEQFGKSILWLAGAFIADYVLMTIFAMPLYLLNPNYETINDNNVAYLVGKYPAVLLILSCGILGPVTEEMVYRLIPVERFSGKIPSAFLVCIPAVLFGLLHVHSLSGWDLLANLPMVATGLIYGFVMLKSRNVTIPVALHVLINLPAILAMLRP